MSSSSSHEDAADKSDSGNENRVRVGGAYELLGPSSSRLRSSGDRVWPEPFLEALAFQVAVDASESIGRFAAAPALFNLFLVCSTWREVSRSELLWQNLTRRVWNRHHLLHPHQTWREEYVFRHRTYHNFRSRRHTYSTLRFNDIVNDDDDDHDEENVLSCRRLALSDRHLAAGFSDGSVRLFHLPSRIHLHTFLPNPRDLIGRFSCAVSGIVLSEFRLVFASHVGDIHVAPTDNSNATRRARYGDALYDGVLVDFCGSNRWWVGLYAGVPGRAFHVLDAESEELVFVGGTLTDMDAVVGWHLLTDELTEFVGRVRLTNQELAIACTSFRMMVFDLGNLGFIVAEEVPRGRVIVGSVDSNGESLVFVDRRGAGSVRLPRTLQETSRFGFRAASGAGGRIVVGCMNLGFVVMCVEGRASVWELENGGYLYDLRERMGEVGAITADECHVAAWSSGDWTRIHLWDFGEQP